MYCYVNSFFRAHCSKHAITDCSKYYVYSCWCCKPIYRNVCGEKCLSCFFQRPIWLDVLLVVNTHLLLVLNFLLLICEIWNRAVYKLSILINLYLAIYFAYLKLGSFWYQIHPHILKIFACHLYFGDWTFVLVLWEMAVSESVLAKWLYKHQDTRFSFEDYSFELVNDQLWTQPPLLHNWYQRSEHKLHNFE